MHLFRLYGDIMCSEKKGVTQKKGGGGMESAVIILIVIIICIFGIKSYARRLTQGCCGAGGDCLLYTSPHGFLLDIKHAVRMEKSLVHTLIHFFPYDKKDAQLTVLGVSCLLYTSYG